MTGFSSTEMAIVAEFGTSCAGRGCQRDRSESHLLANSQKKLTSGPASARNSMVLKIPRLSNRAYDAMRPSLSSSSVLASRTCPSVEPHSEPGAGHRCHLRHKYVRTGPSSRTITSCFVRSFPFTAMPCTSHGLFLRRL